MLLLDFNLPPGPYSFELQFILAGSIVLIEIVLFVLGLLNLKNSARGNYILALLILIAVIAFITGCAFNEHYFSEYLRDETATRVMEAMLYKLKEFFTISSLIGLVLSTITVLLRMWWHQKIAPDRHEK